MLLNLTGILNLKNRLFPSELQLCLKRRMMECEGAECCKVLENNREGLAYGKKNTLFPDKSDRFIYKRLIFTLTFFSTNVIIRK